jgi:hypothetical protein
MGCLPWDIEVDPSCCPGWLDIAEPIRTMALALAADQMWALSGRRFALCEVCVRPCKAFCITCGPTWQRPGMWGVRQGWGPYVNSDGQWFNCGCGCGAGSCCKASCAVYLDPLPVDPSQPLIVKVDGVVQDPASYQVINGKILIRAPGAGCWPDCNDLSLPDTEVGTWSADYFYGLRPPKAGLRVGGILACEIAKQCAGLKCRLPSNVTQLTRDGVSLTLDPKAFIDVGLTALPEVNAWIRQVNPYGLAQPGDVWSVDTEPPYQVTWPASTC